MLRALRLEHFRSFVDTGRVELADLNVFIGPNSAGKSSLMTIIELALQIGIDMGSSTGPLPLERVPSFMSFDAVMRRNGPKRKGQIPQFAITLEWSKAPSAEVTTNRYTLRKSILSGAAFVHRAEYGGEVEVEAEDKAGVGYRFLAPASVKDKSASFDRHFPSTKSAIFAQEFEQKQIWAGPYRGTTVIRPHRPIPRSVYVLDDPLMSPDDRQMITDLVQIWADEKHLSAREQLVESLRTMTLAQDLDVRATTHGRGAVEILVKPREKGRAATLADVGYGVSQVLPLLLQDAKGGSKRDLLVYQPEAHLHPLAQSRLADVFVSSVMRGSRIYVETHSEHLVLRLQTLIAGGVIDPERVRVHCVEHDGKKSNIYPMTFDAKGIPKTPWPKGFLDTGLTLARDLAAARQHGMRRG